MSDEYFTPKEVKDMGVEKASKNLEKIEKSAKHWEELKKQK